MKGKIRKDIAKIEKRIDLLLEEKETKTVHKGQHFGDAYRTVKTTLPFKVFAGSNDNMYGMVDLGVTTLNQVLEILETWNIFLEGKSNGLHYISLLQKLSSAIAPGYTHHLSNLLYR